LKKIALKRLTKSDLTFFIWHFQNGDGGNQKAINLNADVFAKLMFPTIAEEAARHGDRFAVDLDIFGPGVAHALNLQRKIVKGESYKNWRLNGEFVRDDEQRFRPLQEGDFAVLEFEGASVPRALRLVLVARALETDASAHKALDTWLGNRRMERITSAELDEVLAAAKLPDSHPLNGINLQDDLEDAAQGGLIATQRLFKRSTSRKVSKTELTAARLQADETGVIGEEFVNEWLTGERAAKRVGSFEWVSRDNAIAPFDFMLTSSSGQLERLDVKATLGPFQNRIHMSINELLHCVDGSVTYRIFRVFMIAGRTARMRISNPLMPFASEVIPILEKLPLGVFADGISIDPRKLEFGDEISLDLNLIGGE
jgi:uncharacterized protein DUF3883